MVTVDLGIDRLLCEVPSMGMLNLVLIQYSISQCSNHIPTILIQLTFVSQDLFSKFSTAQHSQDQG